MQSRKCKHAISEARLEIKRINANTERPHKIAFSATDLRLTRTKTLYEWGYDVQPTTNVYKPREHVASSRHFRYTSAEIEHARSAALKAHPSLSRWSCLLTGHKYFPSLQRDALFGSHDYALDMLRVSSFVTFFSLISRS